MSRLFGSFLMPEVNDKSKIGKTNFEIALDKAKRFLIKFATLSPQTKRQQSSLKTRQRTDKRERGEKRKNPHGGRLENIETIKFVPSS